MIAKSKSCSITPNDGWNITAPDGLPYCYDMRTSERLTEDDAKILVRFIAYLIEWRKSKETTDVG